MVESWLRTAFSVDVDPEGVEYIEWVAENGNRTRSPLAFVVQMFSDAEDISYDEFTKVVPSPSDEGQTWGNHVRAWRDQGKFDIRYDE